MKRERNPSTVWLENLFLRVQATDAYRTISPRLLIGTVTIGRSIEPNTPLFSRCLNFQSYALAVRSSQFPLYPSVHPCIPFHFPGRRSPSVFARNTPWKSLVGRKIKRKEDTGTRSDVAERRRRSTVYGLRSSVCNLESVLQPASSRSRNPVCSISPSPF